MHQMFDFTWFFNFFLKVWQMSQTRLLTLSEFFIYLFTLSNVFIFVYTWVVCKENQTVLNRPIIVLVLFASPFNYTSSWCFLLGFYEAGLCELLLFQLTDELDWLMNNDGLTDVFIDGHEWLVLSDCTCIYSLGISYIFSTVLSVCLLFPVFFSFCLFVRGFFLWFFLLLVFVQSDGVCHFLCCIMK